MVTLGNFFPVGEKHSHIERRMNPGAVLYLFCTFARPDPKEKYLAIAFLSQDRKPFMLIINSEVSTYIRDRSWLLKCQVKITPADYDFLKRESYIDCAELISHFGYLEVERQLLGDLTRIKGDLGPTTKREIIVATQAARTLTPEQKLLVSQALTPAPTP